MCCMMKNMKQTSGKISCPITELNLRPTLSGGQSFRWRNLNKSWTGVLRGRIWILSQMNDTLFYQCYKPENVNEDINDCLVPKKRKMSHVSDEEDEIILKNYFRLDVNLKKYYEIWSNIDPNFKKSANTFYGVRILNQEIIENLFSFICSSNNNITRISSMVEKLCKLYGMKIGRVDDVDYYSFPEVSKLCSPNVESDLRKAGFGYRAKFIYKSACMIKNLGGAEWINHLQKMTYSEAKNELIKLPGIGPKVADCICLMSLGHLEAIPVDTHIFQVATKIYMPHLKTYKSVTDKVYNEISSYFQNLYGEKAGWAHTILFCSQLKTFQKNEETCEV